MLHAVRKPLKSPVAAANGTNSNEAYFPLVRTLSPSTPWSTNYGLGEGSVPPQSPPLASPTLSSTLARVLPGRRRRNTATEDTAGSTSRTGGLAPTRSRDSDDNRRRSWASPFLRSRTGSFGNPLERTTSTSQTVALASPTLAVVGEQSPDPMGEATNMDVSTPNQQEVEARSLSRPYPTIRKPYPAASHELYPNFTPPITSTDSQEKTTDTRNMHMEVEDDYDGHLWARDDSQHDQSRMVEWNETRGRRERWVGPMLCVPFIPPHSHPTRGFH